MPKYPYVNKYPKRVVDVVRMQHRLGPYPLDPSTVFNTYDDLKEYVETEGTYAYPGQVVAVANGDVFSKSPADFSLYVIKADREIQPILTKTPFTTMEEAEKYLADNPDSFTPGILFSVSEDGIYKLYIISQSGTIEPVVSFVDNISWNDILDKPETVSDLGIPEVATTDEIDYCLLRSDFTTDMLLRSHSMGFRFLANELFKDEQDIDISVDDGKYVVDNYLIKSYSGLFKQDEREVTFHLTPISANLDISSIYLSVQSIGEGIFKIMISNSIDNGGSWSEWKELTPYMLTEYKISEENNMIKLKITLNGPITILGIGLGII